MFKSIPQGAATTIFCAISSAAVPGEYHSDCKPAPGEKSQHACDAGLAARVWALSEELTA